jgi:hypothetical protein
MWVKDRARAGRGARSSGCAAPSGCLFPGCRWSLRRAPPALRPRGGPQAALWAEGCPLGPIFSLLVRGFALFLPCASGVRPGGEYLRRELGGQLVPGRFPDHDLEPLRLRAARRSCLRFCGCFCLQCRILFCRWIGRAGGAPKLGRSITSKRTWRQPPHFAMEEHLAPGMQRISMRWVRRV